MHTISNVGIELIGCQCSDRADTKWLQCRRNGADGLGRSEGWTGERMLETNYENQTLMLQTCRARSRSVGRSASGITNLRSKRGQALGDEVEERRGKRRSEHWLYLFYLSNAPRFCNRDGRTTLQCSHLLALTGENGVHA